MQAVGLPFSQPATLLWWRAVLAALIGVVCFLALSPNPPTDLDSGSDKVNHLLAFAALSVAACFSFPGVRANHIAGFLMLLAFGGAIELMQSSIPGRGSEWGDLLADALGIGIGTMLAIGWRRWRDSRTAKIAPEGAKATTS